MRLDLDGPSVEVQPIQSWNLYVECLAAWAVFEAAEKGVAEYTALEKMYEQFILEAQPQWDIVDHRGTVPLTARGVARLPLDLQLTILAGWRDTFTAEKPEEEREPLPFDVIESDAPSAADAIFPDTAVARQIKRRLRAVKAA